MQLRRPSLSLSLGFVLLAWATSCGDDDKSGHDAGGDEQLDGEVAPDASETGAADAALEADAQLADAGAPNNEACTSCGACEEKVTITSARHLATPIDYPDLPPAGGDHAPCWTFFGVHEEERADEIWVHNLEHGAVVFLYRCDDGCPDELARLKALAAQHPFAIVMPYAQLPAQFGVISWGRRLLSPCFDEGAFQRFYQRNADNAPESVSQDGSC